MLMLDGMPAVRVKAELLESEQGVSAISSLPLFTLFVLCIVIILFLQLSSHSVLCPTHY